MTQPPDGVAASTQQLRDFASELRTKHGDDLGPMFYRDVQRLCDDYELLRAALDSLESILFKDLFGDDPPRSRDELEARAADLVAKEKNLDATLRFMP